MTILLRHLAGSRQGTEQTLDLPEGGAITLGRLPECDVPFDPHEDLSASGRHARLGAEGDGFWLEDLGSSNGTWVNGQRIEGRVTLAPDAVIELGRGGPKFMVARPGESAHIPQTVAMSAIPAAEAGGEQVGARTVALMIGKAQEQTSRKFTAVIAAVAVLLLAAIGVIVFLAVRGESRDEEQAAALEKTRTELDKTRTELDKTRTDLATTQKQMESRVKTERNKQSAHALTARLQQRKQFEDDLEQARVEVSDDMRSEFEQRQKELVESLTSVETTLNARYGTALFMLGYAPDGEVLRQRFGSEPPTDRPGFDEGFCTAFAVSADGWLATNAHCVDALFDIRWDMGRLNIPVTFFAKRNGDSDTVYPLVVESAVLHPAYTHTASPDVGLVKVDLAAAGKAQLDNHVWLATEAQTHALSVGQPIYMLGFPGKVMDPYRVVADFRGGNVARLTSFESEITDAAKSRFVWHTALTSKGTSGSPIFDRFGHVIAVNNGGLSVEKIVTSDGVSQEVKYIYSADGLNFGIRADLVHDLARVEGIALPPPPADLGSMDGDKTQAAAPSEGAPAEAAPAEATPPEPMPAEAAPAEATPPEPTPAETAPAVDEGSPPLANEDTPPPPQ